MQRATFKARALRKAKINATFETPGQLQPQTRTALWHEIPGWQCNKYILRGYRRGTEDVLKALESLTFMHNETWNVYTHLIGAIVLPLLAADFLPRLIETRIIHKSLTDYAIFGMYLCCGEACLILSTVYHLMLSSSHHAEKFWHGMDLLGIVIMTMGTFSSGIYYVFYCDPILQNLHWVLISTTGLITSVLISNAFFKAPRWRTAKISVFVGFGSSSLIPLVHGVQRYGLGHMLQYSGLRWYLLELITYGAGAGLYALRIPERWAPGKFDICGNSHQIFHVAILCAIFMHVTALMQGLTTSHAVGACQPR